MRFVSKYAKYMVNVRRELVEHYATGQSKMIQTPLIAQFDIALVNGDERALARERFSFNGFAQEQDLVTIVEPDARISVFDSRLAQAEHGWTDADRELVEQTLIQNAERLPGDLLVIEEIRLAPPWPTYDAFPGDATQLLLKIEDDGYDFATVLAYEVENQNRSDVTYLLQRAIEHAAEGGERASVVAEEELVG